MLYLNIASNVNICSDLVENKHLDILVEKAYTPLLQFYSDNKVKSSLFFAGHTLEILEKRYPRVLDEFRFIVDEGIVEMGSHTYGHPVLPLIHTRDVIKHMEYSQSIETRIFGKPAKGFLPPEWAFDVTIPSILEKFGLDWMLLLGAEIVGYYGQNQKDALSPGTVLGVTKSNITTVCVYDDPNLWFRNNLFNTFIGVKKPSEFADETYSRIKENIDENENQLLVFYFDLETPAFNYRTDSTNDPCKNFTGFVERFINISGAKPTSITDYLSLFSKNNLKIIHPILTKTYKDFDIWWQGSQKLDLESSLVQNLVWSADDEKPSHPKIDELWKLYLLSQGSDARAAASEQRARGINISGKNIYFGKRERVLEAYNYLRKAENLAREILKDEAF